MNSGLTRGLGKNTVSFPYGLTPFRGRTFLNTPYRCVEVSGLPTLRHLMHIQWGLFWVKQRARSAQILYYSVLRCMEKEVDKEKKVI